MYYQSWLKETELKKNSLQTDSLRRVYVSATSEEREKIAVQILKNEEHASTLNMEIQSLSLSAREREDQ